jgi:pimeloyl-ACP methyl ester carboxylesterase
MESLSAILAPTLVIVGSEDRHFTASKNYLVGKMPNATGIEIPGAKHNVHLSHSDQVNAAVTDFLRSIF